MKHSRLRCRQYTKWPVSTNSASPVQRPCRRGARVAPPTRQLRIVLLWRRLADALREMPMASHASWPGHSTLCGSRHRGRTRCRASPYVLASWSSQTMPLRSSAYGARTGPPALRRGASNWPRASASDIPKVAQAATTIARTVMWWQKKGAQPQPVAYVARHAKTRSSGSKLIRSPSSPKQWSIITRYNLIIVFLPHCKTKNYAFRTTLENDYSTISEPPNERKQYVLPAQERVGAEQGLLGRVCLETIKDAVLREGANWNTSPSSNDSNGTLFSMLAATRTRSSLHGFTVTLSPPRTMSDDFRISRRQPRGAGRSSTC